MYEDHTHNQAARGSSFQEHPTTDGWYQTQQSSHTGGQEVPSPSLCGNEQPGHLLTTDLDNMGSEANISLPVPATVSMNEEHDNTYFSWHGSRRGPAPSIIVSNSQEALPGNDPNPIPPYHFDIEPHLGESDLSHVPRFFDEAQAHEDQADLIPIERLTSKSDLNWMGCGTIEATTGSSDMAPMEQQYFNTDRWDVTSLNHDQPPNQINLVEQNALELGSAMPWNPFDLRGTGSGGNACPHFCDPGISSHVTSEDTLNRSAYSSVSSHVRTATSPTSDGQGCYNLSDSMDTLRPPLTSDNLMRSMDLAHGGSHVSPADSLSASTVQKYAQASTWRDCRPQDFPPQLTSYGRYLAVPDDNVSVVSSVTPSHVPDVIYCEKCGKSYTGRYRRGTLQRHKRLKHTRARGRGEREYPCDINGCSEVYQRQDALLKHQRRRHPELNLPGPVARPHSRRHQSGGSTGQQSSYKAVPDHDRY